MLCGPRAGTMLFHNTEWSSKFLEMWYSHPTVLQGAPDQYVFDRLWEANALHLDQHVAILPVRPLAYTCANIFRYIQFRWTADPNKCHYQRMSLLNCAW